MGPSAPEARPAAIAFGVVPVRAGLAAWHVRPMQMLRVAIACMLVGQLGRIPVLATGGGEAPLLVNDLFVLAMLGAGLIVALATRSFAVDGVGGLGLLFIAVGGLSAVLAIPRFGLTGMQLVVGLAYLARWSAYFGVYLVLVNLMRPRDVGAVWATLEGTILAFAAFGLVQAAFLPHFAQLVYPDSRVYVDWDEQGHRLVSTMLEPNIAGAMILLVFLVQVAKLASGERMPAWKPLLLFAALVATLSRSSILGLVVGGMLILAIRGVSRRLLRIGALVAGLGLVALPRLLQFAQGYNKLTVDESALSRVDNWLRALRLFADNPVIGVGFNTYGFVQERYGFVLRGASSFSVDGGLLFIAVMTGLVGLSLYLGMLALVLRRCRALWRDPATPREWSGLAVGIGVATVSLCVQSLFVNSLLTPFVIEMLSVMWALAFVMHRGVARAPAPPPPVRVVACTLAD